MSVSVANVEVSVPVDAGISYVLVNVEPEVVKVSTVVDGINETVVVLVGPETDTVEISEVVRPGRVVVQGAPGIVTVVELVQPAMVTV